jgi:CRP-like cAMP-binding protein
LRRTLSRYLHVRMLQLARASGCHRFHAVAPRLARWLLMSQDRAHGNRFEMTHEFLASMLGVRRSGVTLAAGVLQRGGLIRYTRGELTVLDRQGMETAACSCYAADQLTYQEGFA